MLELLEILIISSTLKYQEVADLKRPIKFPTNSFPFHSSSDFSTPTRSEFCLPAVYCHHRKSSAQWHNWVFSLSWKLSSPHSTQHSSHFLPISENFMLECSFSTFNINVHCQGSVADPLLLQKAHHQENSTLLRTVNPQISIFTPYLSRALRSCLPLSTWTSACISHRFLKLDKSQTDEVLPITSNPLFLLGSLNQSMTFWLSKPKTYVILNSTLSSSTPTFNEPIRLIDLICKMFLCSVHLFSSHLLHPNLSHCISLLTGLLLQLRLFFNIFLQSKQDFLSF